jgi:hypothetical protein
MTVLLVLEMETLKRSELFEITGPKCGPASAA